MKEQAKRVVDQIIELSRRETGVNKSLVSLPTAKLIASKSVQATIAELLHIDEEVSHSYIREKEHQKGLDVQESIWHKVIKEKVDRLRLLREEINNV